MPVIELDRLRRTYRSGGGIRRRSGREIEAVRGLDLTVERGELFGLLGPNGAGKTTTIKMLITLLLPTSGTARVLGHDVVKEVREVRRRVGYVFGGDRGLYERLSGLDNLRYFAELYAVNPRTQRARIAELIELVGLTGREHERVEGYSRGMRQRLHIARGLLHKPDVLFLDEPSIGIDPVGARELRRTVAALRDQGTTIMLTTHYMFEADELCDRIAVIANGELVALGTPAELKAMVRGGSVLEVEVFGASDAAIDSIRAVAGIRSVGLEERGQAQLLVAQLDPGHRRHGRRARRPRRHPDRPGHLARAEPRGRLRPAGRRDHVSTLRLLAVTWWLQVKIRSRSAFDGLLSLLWPLFFATTIFLLYRAGHQAPAALLSAAVGASAMGIWSATSTTASAALQNERQQGTLELLVAAPTPLPLLFVPITLSMATVGVYSLITTLLWGRFVFGISLHVHAPLLFALSVLVVVIGIGMFGFLLAVASVRYRSSWALGAGIELPVWFICGFLVPLSQLPGWVRPISWLLAPTWGMTAVRHSALGGSVAPALLVCLGLTAAYAVIGTLVTGRIVDAARTRATLALT